MGGYPTAGIHCRRRGLGLPEALAYCATITVEGILLPRLRSPSYLVAQRISDSLAGANPIGISQVRLLCRHYVSDTLTEHNENRCAATRKRME